MRELFGFPILLGLMFTGLLMLLPWATFLGAAGLAWTARREKGRPRLALGAAALYLAAAAAVGLNHRDWQRWHYSGNALALGMTVDEVERYYVDVKFGADGRLETFKSWSD